MIARVIDCHVDKAKGAKTPFIEEALHRGHTVHKLRDSYIPKPIDITGITISGPTIVRGSHGFVNYIQKELNPSPGGFLHATNFQLTTYVPILKDLCVNNNFQIVDYENFKNTEPVFVKPLEAMKQFTGIVVNKNQTIEEAHTEKFGKWFEPAGNCKLVVSPVLEILNEYRVVVVNKTAISASTYDSVELFDLDFVNDVAKIWNPTDVYVVDIADTPSGKKIVEYNQFSTSAMYACNQAKIVDALEEYLNAQGR